jgi:hypothetical protein
MDTMNAAKKAAAQVNKQPVHPPVEAPAATPTPEPTPAPAAAVEAPVAQAVTLVGNPKQVAALEALKVKWTERKVDLSKLAITQDGKYIVVVVGEGWPKITIGNGGGIDLPEIKSYPKAFDAAVMGDDLLAKQSKRGQPKPPSAPAAAAQPEPKKEGVAETPAQRKQREDAALEQKLDAQSAA